MSLIFALALTAAAAPASDPAHDAPGALETIEKVAPGVWSIHQREPVHLQPSGNVEVIEQRNGLVLIDGGGSPGSARRIATLIRSVSKKPVKAIAITHWHGDHSLGATTLLASWPRAEIIATTGTRSHILGTSMEAYAKGAPDADKTRKLLERVEPAIKHIQEEAVDESLPAAVRAGYASNVKDLALYVQDFNGAFLPTKISTFETKRIMADPVRPVELRFLGRGNTDGDLIAWLPKQQILATGDLVVAPIPFGFGSYPKSWQAVLDKLIALHARTIIPGHGSPMHDYAYIRQLRDMIADLRARMAVTGPKEDLDQAKKDIASAFESYVKRFAGEDLWLQDRFFKWWRDPISEALWKESRGLPIEQDKG